MRRPTGCGESADAAATTLEQARIATAKGALTFRAADHQAVRPLYHFRIKQSAAGRPPVPVLVREWRFE
jgi:branched-chain amino acid transport system substrate-binding protein